MNGFPWISALATGLCFYGGLKWNRGSWVIFYVEMMLAALNFFFVLKWLFL